MRMVEGEGNFQKKKKKNISRGGGYKIQRCKGSEWIGSGDKGDRGGLRNVNGPSGRGGTFRAPPSCCCSGGGGVKGGTSDTLSQQKAHLLRNVGDIFNRTYSCEG